MGSLTSLKNKDRRSAGIQLWVKRRRSWVKDSNQTFAVPVGPEIPVLQVEACGLCGTDHDYRSCHTRDPGHETVTYQSIGSAAAKWQVDVGDQ